jgi:lipopolysaccharide transport system permease protein
MLRWIGGSVFNATRWLTRLPMRILGGAARPRGGCERALTPPQSSLWQYMRSVWRERRLLPFLARRAIRFRTKGAILGSFWLVLRSFFVVLPFSFVLGSLAGGEVEGVPYLVLLLFGLCFWNYFVGLVVFASRSMRIDRDITEHLNIPHMLMVLATTAPILLEFLFSLGLVYVVTLLYAWQIDASFLALGWELLLLGVPVLLGITVFALGIGLIFAVCSDYARDFRMMLPQLLSVWMLATPVIYPLDYVPGRWKILLKLNPLCGYVEGFRLAFLGVGHVSMLMVLYGAAWSILMFLLGAWFFHRVSVRSRLSESGL